MRKRVVSAVLISLGSLLIVAAFLLVGYNIWDDNRARESVDHILSQLESMRPAATPTPAVPSTPSDGEEPSLPDYVLDPNREMPTVEIDGYRYIGTLRIPSLELELPIMETWDYTRIQIAPCRFTGSVYLHNMILCAHNYTSHFGRLKNLVPGDAVEFTDMDGNVFHYEVAETETLAKTAVEEMQSGGWDLTLFTCTVGGVSRVTVRCTEV